MSLMLPFYSHLKKRIAAPAQMTVTPSITRIGNIGPDIESPKNVAFINSIPWVSGKSRTTLCMALGITSMGSVVPENTSMGKYRMDAMTPACLLFFATPPIQAFFLCCELLFSHVNFSFWFSILLSTVLRCVAKYTDEMQDIS